MKKRFLVDNFDYPSYFVKVVLENFEQKLNCRCYSKFSIVVFLLGLLAANALAGPVVIFNEQVRPGYFYNTTIGELFKVSFIPSEDKLVVDFPGDTLVISNNSCASGSRVKGCFNGGFFKGYNHSLPDREVWEYALSLYFVAPDIVIAKDMERSIIDVGDEVVVKVNISNKGSGTGTVLFRESIPQSLLLIELPGQPCSLSFNNSLFMPLELEPGQVVVCSYNVRPLSPGAHILTSSAEFETTKAEKATASATLTASPLPVFINASIPAQVRLGEVFNITFRLSSSVKVEPFSFSSSLPQSLEVLAVSNIASQRREGGVAIISYEGALSNKSDIIINVTVEAVGVGTHSFSSNGSWVYNTFKQSISDKFNVNVTLASPYLRFASYGNGAVFADVVNPSHLPISDVVLDFPGFVIPTAVPEIGSMSHSTVALQPVGEAGNSSGLIRYSTIYRERISVPASLSFSISEAGPGLKNENLQEEKAEPQPSTGTVPPSKLGRKPRGTELKVAAVMVGLIMLLVVAFFTVRARSQEKIDLML